MVEKFAVSRLHLKDGTLLTNQVVIVCDEEVKDYHELKEEEPFTEWRGGDFYIR